MKDLTLPTYEDVAAAAERIKGLVNKTPVLTSRTINDEFEAEVFFKCENFQRVGAFKFRGAMNALLQFNEAQKSWCGCFLFGKSCTSDCAVFKNSWHSSNYHHAPRCSCSKNGRDT